MDNRNVNEPVQLAATDSTRPIAAIKTAPGPSRAGVLRSDISLTIQTRAASKLWHGKPRAAKRGKYAVIGVPQFAAAVRQIANAAALNDPYADWWLLRIQSALQEARSSMQRFAETVDEFIAQTIPDGLSVGEALSVSAERAQAGFATPLAYVAAYLIADFDRVARKILLASHIALINRTTAGKMMNEGFTIARRAMGSVAGYQYSGATREDFAANNGVAQRALALMGQCPEPILQGTQRSEFAPYIRTKVASVAAPKDDGNELPHELELLDEAAGEEIDIDDDKDQGL